MAWPISMARRPGRGEGGVTASNEAANRLRSLAIERRPPNEGLCQACPADRTSFQQLFITVAACTDKKTKLRPRPLTGVAVSALVDGPFIDKNYGCGKIKRFHKCLTSAFNWE